MVSRIIDYTYCRYKYILSLPNINELKLIHICIVFGTLGNMAANAMFTKFPNYIT